MPKKLNESQKELWANLYVDNTRLLTLIEKFKNDELFLAYFFRKWIDKNKNEILKPEYSNILNEVLDRFSENIFIEKLGLYKSKKKPKKLGKYRSPVSENFGR